MERPRCCVFSNVVHELGASAVMLRQLISGLTVLEHNILVAHPGNVAIHLILAALLPSRQKLGSHGSAHFARLDALWQRPCGAAALEAAGERVELRGVRGVVGQREVRVRLFGAPNRGFEGAVVFSKRTKFRSGVLTLKPTFAGALWIVR